jgi:hypothetical protein
MGQSGQDVARRPYAATWYGNVTALAGRRGVISVHARANLALAACQRQRDALRGFWGAYKPWFAYAVIDRRTGDTIHTVQ